LGLSKVGLELRGCKIDTIVFEFDLGITILLFFWRNLKYFNKYCGMVSQPRRR